MAEDETGWSEKSKSGRGKRSSEDEGSASATPSRPSKRKASKDDESTVVRTPAASDAGARKVAKAAATAGQRDVSFASRLGFPALVAVICLVGIALVWFARTTREPLALPRENLDHWHAAYGVYNCNNTGEGDLKFLPMFQSTQDLSGIHSHGDGLMHIHPFTAASSGDSATMRHWFDEMNVTVNEERISVQNAFDAPVELVAGEECADGTGKAEIKVLRWKFDFAAAIPVDEGRPEADDIYSENFGEIKFNQDREVFLIAYVGENTDLSTIPSPPLERIELLDNVSADRVWDPEGNLLPQDTGVDIDDADTGSDDAAETESDE